jgi:hypothetical protein
MSRIIIEEAIRADIVIGIHKRKGTPHEMHLDDKQRLTRFVQRYNAAVPIISRLGGADAKYEINSARAILESVRRTDPYLRQEMENGKNI